MGRWVRSLDGRTPAATSARSACFNEALMSAPASRPRLIAGAPVRRAVAGLATVAVALVIGCAARQASVPYPLGSAGEPRRGGHAVFVREEDPDYLDPALSYGTYSAPLIEGVYRTLLEYADRPGPAGAVLQPELAESLPDVREGGATLRLQGAELGALQPPARPPHHGGRLQVLARAAVPGRLAGRDVLRAHRGRRPTCWRGSRPRSRA